MKLSQLQSSSITTIELLHPLDGEPTGVLISGYTPDSKEWKRIESEISGRKKQSLILEKKQSRIEIDTDAAEKRNRLLMRSITDISGIEEWGYSEAAANQLLSDPVHSWMLEQWGEHLDDRKNFFNSAGKAAKTGLAA